MKWTWQVTITKTLTGAVAFFILWVISNSSLPSCSTAQGGESLIEGNGCLTHQSYLHDGLGWLALICLISAGVLFVRKMQARDSEKKNAGESK